MVKGKKGRKRMKREDLMMATEAKPTASLFLSTERKKAQASHQVSAINWS